MNSSDEILATLKPGIKGLLGVLVRINGLILGTCLTAVCVTFIPRMNASPHSKDLLGSSMLLIEIFCGIAMVLTIFHILSFLLSLWIRCWVHRYGVTINSLFGIQRYIPFTDIEFITGPDLFGLIVFGKTGPGLRYISKNDRKTLLTIWEKASRSTSLTPNPEHRM